MQQLGKFTNYIVFENDKTNKLLQNQEHLCYICSQTFILNDIDESQLIVKTLCNHFFHYNCLQSALEYSHYGKKECPYCRSYTGWLPLTSGLPKKIIHKEFKKKINEKIYCKAVIQSGKKKGTICGCKANFLYQNLCGRHKNYKFPEKNTTTINNTEECLKKNWFKGQIIKCYK